MIKSKISKLVQIGMLMASTSFLHADLPLCEDIWESGLNSTNEMSFGGVPGGSTGDESTMYDSNGTFVAPSYDTGAGHLRCPGSGILDPETSTFEICLDSGSPRYLLGLTDPPDFPGTHGAFYVEQSYKGDKTSLDPTMYLQHYDVTEVDIGQVEDTYVTIAAWDGEWNTTSNSVIPGTGGVHKPHTVTVNERLQVFDGSSLNCGHDGQTPGDPNDLFIFVSGNSKQFQLQSNTCFSGFVYMEEGSSMQIGDSNVTIVGGLSATGFNKLVDVNITYVKPKYAPDYCGPTVGWRLVGVPGETNGVSTVEDVFGDEFNSSEYNATWGATTGWSVLKRDFNGSANNSWYEVMDLNSTVTPTGNGYTLDTSRGYWLRADLNITWDSNNSTPLVPPTVWTTGNGCTTDGNGGCVEYALVLPHSSCGSDPSGPFRNIMIGYPGRDTARWVDYRFDINNTTVENPANMAAAGYATDQIWQYNPVSHDYDTCNSLVGICETPSHKGFWVQLRCGAKDLTSIDLIIPNGQP